MRNFVKALMGKTILRGNPFAQKGFWSGDDFQGLPDLNCYDLAHPKYFPDVPVVKVPTSRGNYLCHGYYVFPGHSYITDLYYDD